MSAYQGHLPGSPARNGVPERVNYTPRKGAVDQMPHLTAEDLAPYAGGYEEWLPGFTRGFKRGSRRTADGGRR